MTISGTPSRATSTAGWSVLRAPFYGTKTPIVAGMLLLAAGMAVMSLVRADGNFAADVLPASLIAAAGMSLAFIPSLGTAIQSAKPQ